MNNNMNNNMNNDMNNDMNNTVLGHRTLGYYGYKEYNKRLQREKSERRKKKYGIYRFILFWKN